MFSKLVATLKKPAVSHALAIALTAAGTALATGHFDIAALLQALGK